MSFLSKTAIVTGGCGGLGAAISKAFLDAGANVVAIDMNRSLTQSFASTHASPKLLVVEGDITSEPTLDKLFSDAISKFGQVDCLVNNAGIMDRMEPAGELEKSAWDRVIAVNLTAPYMTSRRLAQHVMEKGHLGSIVNVSSVAGVSGYTAGASYTSSKWGLLGLTKNTAAFYSDKNLRCNAIMPGPMETHVADHLQEGYSKLGMAMQEKKRVTMGPPSPLSEVAALVLFLSSDSAKTISGSTVPIDSAWSAF
ncbi:Diacetyl reductase [Sphaceloma murrayae]|uniref:Diacetyl reductase n=1 Tax=Sphaceloma murrayae TaxID=2082308 RepID=A0A2K1R3J1_9PEZI|nr:Diacetyl reductase [Sphaceloma murrayae]